MTTVDEFVVPACADDPAAFLEDTLEASPGRRPTSASRRALAQRRADAHRRCAACPILTDCLYRAVVQVNVSGFVACTTEPERKALRRRLGISVTDTEVAGLGTARLGGGPVDHETVLAARQAHPQETCQQLADRLGCSTSTVKRHLRRARQEAAVPASPAPSSLLPTLDEVLDAFDELESVRHLTRVD